MSDPVKRVLIVGAGFAGLSAAVRLAERGVPVTVVESTKHGGGRSRSFAHAPSGEDLDNGQHLMMGCYRETLAFLRSIGQEGAIEFQRNLRVDMVKPGGGRVSMQCPALPAPFHLAAGLLGMRGLGVLNKASAMRAGLLLRGEVDRPDDTETCDAWLTRLGQSQGIRGAFWDPLIWAVLNDDPLVASAGMLMAVLERAFLATRDASRLGVPRLPLSRLYVDGAMAKLRERGADIRMGQAVRTLDIEQDRAVGVTLKSGDSIRAEHVITAVPPVPLLDMLPEAARRHPVFQDVERLEVSPIINLWVWLDRPLFEDVPFLGLVASPLHWLFDRNTIEGRSTHDGTLLNVTISGARSLVNDSPDVLMNLFRAEMDRYFPDRTYEVRDQKIIKEKRATIGHAAGTYHRRPEIRSPIDRLWVAGDWVRTGLPATIESACQSGHDAADLILGD